VDGPAQTIPALATNVAHLWPARLAAALLGLAVVTCMADLDVRAPTGMPTGKTVTADQLWQIFDSSLPPGVWISPLENSSYEVISAKWMRKRFLPALRHQMTEFWEQKVPAEDSAGNCNGFALVCRLMLSLSAMDAGARAPATATVIVRQEKPFGGLYATKEDHCVAFVLTDEGPWIIEVQSGVYTKIADYPNRGTIKLVSVH
jgi:hypothetical protein